MNQLRVWIFLGSLASGPVGQGEGPAVIRVREVVTVGREQVAAVCVPEGATCAWNLEGGGALTDGSGTDTVHFRAHGPGRLRLSCTVEGMPDLQPVTVEAVAASVPPDVAAPAHATAFQGGYRAAVTPQQGCTYHWTLDHGGRITAGADEPSVTFTAGGPGALTLTCAVTNAAGEDAAEGSAVVQVAAAPWMPTVHATARAAPGQADLLARVPPQPGATYQWTVDGGRLTGGAGTPSIRFTAGTRGSVLLSCRVVNPAGSASEPGRSVVDLLPNRVLIQTPAWAVAGRPCTARILRAAGTCAWELQGDAAIAEGQGTGTLTFVPGRAGVMTLTCRTPAGSDTVRVRVGEAPGILAFRAGTARLPEGGTTTVTPCFTGGRGILLPAAREVENGQPITLEPRGGDGFELVVVGPAGDVVRQALPLEVDPHPRILGFTASEHRLAPGEEVTLTALFEGGQAEVEPAVGGVASGEERVIRPTGSGVYTLRVSSPAGETAVAQVRVEVGEPGEGFEWRAMRP